MPVLLAPVASVCATLSCYVLSGNVVGQKRIPYPPDHEPVKNESIKGHPEMVYISEVLPIAAKHLLQSDIGLRSSASFVLRWKPKPAPKTLRLDLLLVVRSGF